MNKYLTISTSAALLSGLFLITGCSSSGGDGGTTTPTATVPANAVEINDTNAEATVALSISTVRSLDSINFDSIFAVETSPVIALTDALDIVKPMIKNRLNSSGIDPVTGTVFSDNGTCLDGGTWSVSGDETYNPPNWSETFTATFSNCNEYDYIIDGTVSGAFTENEDTGDYTDKITGSLSVILTYDSTGKKTSFTGVDFYEAGNWKNYTYTISKSTYTVDFIVDGVSSGGFLATLNADIVENSGDYDYCPESGHIFITGANNTTAEGIYNGDGRMTIKANGTVVNPSAQCY